MNNQRKRKQKSTNAPIFVVFLLAVLCLVVVLMLRGKASKPDTLEDSSALPASSSEATTAETEPFSGETIDSTAEPSTEEQPMTIDNVITSAEDTTESPSDTDNEPPTTKQNAETGRIVVDVNRDDWYFIVVNSGREMPEGYVPQLKEILGCGKYLDYRVAPYYEEMYYAAKQDGITLTPYSAYRSYERQKNNYNNLTNSYKSQYNLSEAEARKKAATVILPPGTSEHNLGFAMDVCNTKDSFANTKEYAWLQQHAHEYGFILRYTAEKQPITGIVPEPWHWRFVGVENAEKIKNSGLCLEEYLDSIGVAY